MKTFLDGFIKGGRVEKLKVEVAGRRGGKEPNQRGQNGWKKGNIILNQQSR